MIRKELLTVGLIAAMLALAVPSSVYAHDVDEEKQLKVEIEAEHEVGDTEYELKVKVKGEDGGSLKGEGHYKIKSDGDNAKVRNLKITWSQVSNDGHFIIMGSDGFADIVVSLDHNTVGFVTVRTTAPDMESHTFPVGTFEIEVEND